MLNVRVFLFRYLLLVPFLVGATTVKASAAFGGKKIEKVVYGSSVLPNHVLTVVYLEDGGAEFLLKVGDKLQRLNADPDSRASMLSDQGRPLLDSTFTSVLLQGPVKTSAGITVYTSVSLYRKAGAVAVFSLGKTKPPAIVPGKVYSYGDDNAYGIIRFKKTGSAAYSFSGEFKAADGGNAGCNAEGELVFKNGVAYMREQQIDGADDCALLFYLDQDKLYVFMLSDGYFCACAPGGTLEGVYNAGL